ncbi:glycosyltransferase [Emticicia sp. TH156]|uniref:glycosyltransferase n=1 Tax=Emticicia sp. TH156 TaxID=2067454 RepID=UPI000C77F729|nr:glycosyltransferase [Emticicia sp. TH156]PLK45504.1 glycosyl transferase family 1 [Emticicia sp. TH156]
MLKEIDAYIVIAQQEWELNLGSNARNLAVEFSKNKPVMYVNPAIDIKSVYKQANTEAGKRRLKLSLGFGENTFKAADNLWVHTPATVSYSINWLRNISLYNFLNRRNGKGFFNSLKKALKQLGWNAERCVVLNDSQMFTGLYTKAYLRPLLSFYYIRDNLVEHPYFKFHGTRIEPDTIKDADAVFANSAYLAQYARQFHQLSLDIGQGCETDMYDPDQSYQEPADLKDIPKPRIGYTGFLTGKRLDIKLLEELATTRKEWQFVLIGPEEAMFQASQLHGMSNVHFLGSKKPAQLPAYIRFMDVCMNPQLVNELTIGNYPRKIDEYLAMGKPTVATDTIAMQMFLPHVELAVGTQAYIKAIEKALQPQTEAEKKAAIACGKSHTWEACVEKIFEVQNQLLAGK